MKAHAFRLQPGEDLRRSIESIAAGKKIAAGAVVTCVGSLTHAAIRYAGEQHTAVKAGKFEIVSLEGAVSVNGSHLHIAIADNRGQMTGGHLQYGSLVYTTAEVVIIELPGLEFLRSHNASTGYKELVVRTTSLE